ncbi:hypothetical protein C2845_PM13G05010 [Panicum miliaceum]|uniref:Uncharacterized protein n=1 Tax=Panicum miliaceum TaxID=4540 RepID=A0A3L6RJW5_PANMI|nr:hypothetical protein C2845_PM13G05010 [Panicum miliaceum]
MSMASRSPDTGAEDSTQGGSSYQYDNRKVLGEAASMTFQDMVIQASEGVLNHAAMEELPEDRGEKSVESQRLLTREIIILPNLIFAYRAHRCNYWEPGFIKCKLASAS